MTRSSYTTVLYTHSKRSYVVQWTYESVSIPNSFTQSHEFIHTLARTHTHNHTSIHRLRCWHGRLYDGRANSRTQTFSALFLSFSTVYIFCSSLSLASEHWMCVCVSLEIYSTIHHMESVTHIYAHSCKHGASIFVIHLNSRMLCFYVQYVFHNISIP